MVVMHQFSDRRDALVRSARAIKQSVRRLAMPECASYELMVGRANTAVAVKGRIVAVNHAVSEVMT